jgi:hypothetical protein
MVQPSRHDVAPVDRARIALSHSPIHALRQLRVDQSETELHISGCVESYYHKQLAQESVRAVAAGWRVVNAVAVDQN